MMKLVVYCAAGSACVTPIWRLRQMGAVGGGTVALFEAIVVPLVWTGLSFILVRRGAWRDGLITILLLWPVSVVLAIAGWMLFAYTIPAYGRPYGTDALALALHALVIATLLASAVFLSRRLWSAYRSSRSGCSPARP
jgi:hypothetical protein